MFVFLLVLSFIISATSVSIKEPLDGETYNGDWLPLKVIVENDNELPDSVHYTLNDGPVTLIARLNTDWPTYMQNFQNHGFSESPAPMDNTVLWSAPVTGEYHEFPTPVTADGMVYYTTDSLGYAATDTLFALDAATGDIIWTYDTGYADDAVTVVAGRVYSAADSIYCLDALTGTPVWVNGCANRDGGTPVVSNGRVFCGVGRETESTVFCLNADDGSILWSTALPGGSQASCMGLDDGRLFVPTSGVYLPGAGLYALDVSNGSIIWQNMDAFDGYWDSSPVIVNDMIYICGMDGYARAIDAVTGQTEWATPITPGEDYIAATPVIAYNRMFFGDQVSAIHCLDPVDGNFMWSTPDVVHHGSSGVAEGVLFFGEALMYPWSEDSASVRAFDCFDGMEIWSYTTPCAQYMGHSSSPSITDGVMYYACTDGNLYAFGTGLKYTYREDYFYAEVGENQLIVTSFYEGVAVAADTVSFTVTGTGFNLVPSKVFGLIASPNPSVSVSTVSFELPEPGFTTIGIFDLTGRLVRSLVSAELVSGSHTLQWDGRSQSGEEAASGLYLCRIESGGIVESTGMCLLR